MPNLQSKSPYSGISLFSLNIGKHGPEITPYLDIFHVVNALTKLWAFYEKARTEKIRNFQNEITEIFFLFL